MKLGVDKMLWFIILIVCTSLDCFVYAIEKGATTNELTIKKVSKHSIVFGLTNMMMILIGYIIADIFFTEELININRYFACIVLVFLGLMFFLRPFISNEFVERLNMNFNCMDSFKKARILGIDILLIGICFYYLNIPLMNQLIIAFCFSFAAVYIGLFLGYYLGAAYQKGIYATCGVLSLLVAFVQMSSIL